MSFSPDTITLPMEEYQRLSSFATSMSELTQRLANLERTTGHTPVSSRYPSEPRISDPSYFDGRRNLLKNFVSQLRLVIFGQPSRYPTERSKVMFAASFLRDSAFSWFQPYLNAESCPVLDDFDMFIDLLESAFGDPDETINAERKLSLLSQSASAIQYASEFRRIAALTQWNDPAKCYHFYNGLKPAVKDELSKVKRPTHLNDLMELAISIDNRLHDRNMERNTSRHFPRTSDKTIPIILFLVSINVSLHLTKRRSNDVGRNSRLETQATVFSRKATTY